MKNALFLSGLILLSSVRLFAQPGTLDPTFGTGGKVADTTGFEIALIALQSDGKLVAAGSRTGPPETWTNEGVLARYNVDGTPDLTFNSSGSVITSEGEYCNFTNVALQADGMIVVAGNSQSLIGTESDPKWDHKFILKRYHPDGNTDLTFNGTGEVIQTFSAAGTILTSIVLQPDNKVIIAGENDSVPVIARYTTNGTLDPSFGSNGIVTWNPGTIGKSIGEITLQADGKIVIVGSQNNYQNDDNESDLLIARFMVDGSIDTTFNGTGFVTSPGSLTEGLNTVVIQPDGKIVVGGNVSNYSSDIYNGLLGRYNPDGTPDLSFSNDGIMEIAIPALSLFISQVMIQTDGKLIVAGTVSPDDWAFDSDFLIMRYFPDGSADAGYGTGGMATTSFFDELDEAYSAVLQPDGKIVIAGGGNDENHLYFEMARYLGDADPHAGLTENNNSTTHIFPNPTSSTVTVQLTSGSDRHAYKLTDAAGRIIQSGSFTGNEAELNMESCNSGTYLLELPNEGIRQVIVKQ